MNAHPPTPRLHQTPVGPARVLAQHETARRAGYISAIIVNAALVVVAHNLVAWGVPFVTEAWNSVLWAVNLSLSAAILANTLFLAYDPRWFHELTQLVLSVIAFYAMLVVFRVFPFDFGAPATENLALFAMFGVLLAFGIAIVVQGLTFIVHLAQGPASNEMEV